MKLIRSKRARTQRGSYLIELLVAIAISGFLAVALSASLSEQMRVTSGAENQLKAAEVAQQVIERIRESTQPLPAFGVYPVPLNSDDIAGVAGTAWFQKRPLNLDLTNLNYPNMQGDNFVGAGSNGHAEVTATIAPGTTSTTSLVTVTVAWTENSGNRTANFSTTISKIPLVTTAQPGIHL